MGKKQIKKSILRNKERIIDAVKIEGSYAPNKIFYLFEERLFSEEVETVESFLNYIHNNNLAFGHGNYEMRVDEFINQL